MKTQQLNWELIKHTVDEIYGELENSNSPEYNIALIEKYNLQKERIKRNKYPAIELSISNKEIEQMIENKIIDKEGNLNKDLAQGNFSLTTLEKLLYSVLWKNGDLSKIKYIIRGIENNGSNIENGQVFFRFGRFLSDKEEPIIDQHVIRTSLIRNAIGNNAIEKAIGINQIGKDNIEDVKKYIAWINRVCKGKDNRKAILVSIDEVLFALGKKIKKGKLTTAST